MRFTACIAYDISYYATIEIEAETPELAIEVAKQRAAAGDDEYQAAYDIPDNHRVVDVTDSEGCVIAECIDAKEVP